MQAVPVRIAVIFDLYVDRGTQSYLGRFHNSFVHGRVCVDCVCNLLRRRSQRFGKRRLGQHFGYVRSHQMCAQQLVVLVPEPVLEVRVRPRAGALRCSRCGRRHRGYDQGGGVRRWRGQDFGLLARRTGRRHAARGLPEVRRRGRLRAVGGTGQPVHQGFRVFCFNVCSTGSAVFFRSVG